MRGFQRGFSVGPAKVEKHTGTPSGADERMCMMAGALCMGAQGPKPEEQSGACLQEWPTERPQQGPKLAMVAAECARDGLLGMYRLLNHSVFG